MAFVFAALRIFLSAFLLANGLNFWFHLLPITPPDSETAVRLMDGLVFSGLFGVVKYVEVAAGLALLANRFVPLALAMMLPLTVVIVFVDMILINTPESWIFGSLLAVPHLLLILGYLPSYLPMFRMRNDPRLISAEDAKGVVLS